MPTRKPLKTGGILWAVFCSLGSIARTLSCLGVRVINRTYCMTQRADVCSSACPFESVDWGQLLSNAEHNRSKKTHPLTHWLLLFFFLSFLFSLSPLQNTSFGWENIINGNSFIWCIWYIFACIWYLSLAWSLRYWIRRLHHLSSEPCFQQSEVKWIPFVVSQAESNTKQLWVKRAWFIINLALYFKETLVVRVFHLGWAWQATICSEGGKTHTKYLSKKGTECGSELESPRVL